MDVLAEQRDYYRHRAPEYDQWWQRRGRYTLDPEAERGWFADIAETEQALDTFAQAGKVVAGDAPAGDVLEYAAGTGWWTERLTRHARHVTAVDANTETLDLNRRRTGDSGKVTYLTADIFTWTPPENTFDTVFFAYWLSHVPESLLSTFWAHVRRALRPGGRVFLIDSYHHQRLAGDLQQRRLNDGRQFQVIKRYWQPDELESTPGWRLKAQITTHRQVIHAHGTPI